MAYLFHLRAAPRCKICRRRATRRLVGQNLRLVGFYCHEHAGAEFARQVEAERLAIREVRQGT